MRTGAKHDGNEQDDGHDEVHVGPDGARDVDGQPVVLVIIVAKCVSLVVRSSVDRLVRHALIGRRHLSEQRPTTAEHRHFGSTAGGKNGRVTVVVRGQADAGKVAECRQCARDATRQ